MLSFHVDYWDHLGWKDPFAQRAWTDRQKACARALGSGRLYTPMVVVAGRVHTSDGRRARDAWAKALEEKPPLDLAVRASLADGRVAIRATARKTGELPAGARVFAALAQDGLVTRPPAGENRGAELRESAIVRALGEGRAVDGELSWEFPAARDWKAETLRAVVFVQDPATWRVFAAAQARPGP